MFFLQPASQNCVQVNVLTNIMSDDDDDNNEALGLKLRLCTEMDETSGWSTDCRGQLCLLMMITVMVLMNMVMVISHGLKD